MKESGHLLIGRRRRTRMTPSKHSNIPCSFPRPPPPAQATRSPRLCPVPCAAQCLGEIYRLFGRKITAGLIETSSIVVGLMKYHEDFVRQYALLLLENALVGSGGGAAAAAYLESFGIVMRGGVSEKSFLVRVAAARCLKAFSNIGDPGLGMADLDTSMTHCVKALEDIVSSVRDSFAEALCAILALSVNPDAQVKKGGKKQSAPTKKFEDSMKKHLILPFVKGKKAHISNVSDMIKDCSNYFKSICDKQTNRSKKRFLYDVSMGGVVVLQLHRRDPLYWDGV